MSEFEDYITYQLRVNKYVRLKDKFMNSIICTIVISCILAVIFFILTITINEKFAMGLFSFILWTPSVFCAQIMNLNRLNNEIKVDEIKKEALIREIKEKGELYDNFVQTRGCLVPLNEIKVH